MQLAARRGARGPARRDARAGPRWRSSSRAATSPTQVHDYADQLTLLDIGRDAYSSIYYTLLGAAHAHVAAGLLFDLWLLWKLARGLTTYRVRAVQAIAFYWLAVGVLTVVVDRHPALGGGRMRKARDPAVERAVRRRAVLGAEHVVGYGVDRGALQPRRRRLGHRFDLWEALVTGLAWGFCLAAALASVAVILLTRGSSYESAPPAGRLRFFAIAALAANAIFMVALLLYLVGTLSNVVCRQG